MLQHPHATSSQGKVQSIKEISSASGRESAAKKIMDNALQMAPNLDSSDTGSKSKSER